MKIDALWNMLIINKYDSKIDINLDKLKKIIENRELLTKNYLLSEILFEIKNKEELTNIFECAGIKTDKLQVFTCGSGVTACILAMANKIINDKNPIIYDGSWSEYGLK